MPQKKRLKTFRRLLLALLAIMVLLALWIAAPALLVQPAKLEKERPKTTALMKIRQKQADRKGKKYRIDQRWVPLAQISPHLLEAVRVSEDANFWGHGGVDWAEARETLKYNWKKKRFARGASTITMQLARNLYLSPSKNPLRKLQEIVIAYRLEKSLSKARIMELYLNLVEWGPGIFGAEAAAQSYFHKSARSLTSAEAARLAAVLPSPLRWNPASDQKVVLRRQRLILRRMHINTDEQ